MSPEEKFFYWFSAGMLALYLAYVISP